MAWHLCSSERTHNRRRRKGRRRQWSSRGSCRRSDGTCNAYRTSMCHPSAAKLPSTPSSISSFFSPLLLPSNFPSPGYLFFFCELGSNQRMTVGEFWVVVVGSVVGVVVSFNGYSWLFSCCFVEQQCKHLSVSTLSPLVSSLPVCISRVNIASHQNPNQSSRRGSLIFSPSSSPFENSNAKGGWWCLAFLDRKRIVPFACFR